MPTTRPRSPILQLAVCPRWLEYSGLPQALGATRWAVFRALVVLDHQTLGMEGRRRGKQRWAFAVPQRDLIAMTGLTDRTIRRAMQLVAASKLLRRYRPGRGREKSAGGQWGEYEIDTDTLVSLYRYVGPRLAPLHGGTQGVARNQLPDEIQIYGREELHGVCVDWKDLSMGQDSKRIGEEPEVLDAHRVAEICGF